MAFNFEEIHSISKIHFHTWQDVLFHSHSINPFLDYHWISNWLQHFARGNPLNIYLAQNEANETLGIFPLIAAKDVLLGVKSNILSFPANSHSFRTDLLTRQDQRAELFTAWFNHVKATQKFDYLKFKEFLYDPKFFAVLKERGIPFTLEEKKQPPYLNIKENWETYFKARRGHFRRNLRRRIRNAQKEFGAVTYRVFNGSNSELEGWISAGLTLEASGWKGKKGSAILNSEEVKKFYLDVAQNFNARKMLHLGAVYFGERMVAFNFSLIYRDVFYLLKIAYDENVPRYSPGQIMMFHLLQWVFGQGLQSFDFLGPSMPWKLEWTEDFHEHYTLLFYGPTFKGRYLYFINSKIVPLLRKNRWMHKFKEKAGV